MSRPKFEVADVFRRHGAAWRAANKAHLSLAQRRVMTAIEVCRTAALGGHVERWLRPAARGRDGGVREELAAGVTLVCGANRAPSYWREQFITGNGAG
jgi:hypothetical protein